LKTINKWVPSAGQFCAEFWAILGRNQHRCLFCIFMQRWINQFIQNQNGCMAGRQIPKPRIYCRQL